jgi:hypothetical protein
MRRVVCCGSPALESSSDQIKARCPVAASMTTIGAFGA